MLFERECKTCGKTFRAENGRVCWDCRIAREKRWVVEVRHDGTDVLVGAYRPNDSWTRPSRAATRRITRPTERRIEKAKAKTERWCERANEATELADQHAD